MDWKSRVLRPILSRYNPNDVFNADETGLYWRMLPDKTHTFKGEPCTGTKMSKERVTVLVCANMTGTEKSPLLTIGKFKKPRCFRGVLVLPTEYEANPSAWMNSSIFEDWLRKWDNKLKRAKRKIVLFVDNCKAHPHIESKLECIELVFLPPNTTSEIQPCDQGIINTMKVYYRKCMVKSLLRAIDNGSSFAQFKITLLDSIHMLKKAWESVTPLTISNCFKKGGFVVPDQTLDDDPFADSDSEESSDESDPLAQLSLTEPCTFEEYVRADENLQCSPMPTTEDIISSIATTESDVSEEEEDDTGEPLAAVTHQQAYDAFLKVRSYLLLHLSDESPYLHVGSTRYQA